MEINYVNMTVCVNIVANSDDMIMLLVLNDLFHAYYDSNC